MPLARLLLCLIVLLPLPARPADGAADELYPARQSGKYGYIDASGRMVLPATYDFALPFSDGLAEVQTNGKGALIDRSGRTVLSPLPPHIWSCSEGRCAFAGEDNRTGYLDTSGQVAIAPRFESGSSFSEGLAAVRIGDVSGYIDPSGNLVIAANFDVATEFHCGRAFIVKVDGDRIGLIDRSGRIVVEPQFDEVGDFRETDRGCLAPAEIDLKWGYIGINGDFVIPRQFDEAGEFGEGLAFVQVRGKSRYIDSKGRTAFTLPVTATNGSRFSQGMARIEFDSEKYGFVTKDGHIAVRPTFSSASDFRGEVAHVNFAGKSGYIDRLGKFRWPLSD